MQKSLEFISRRIFFQEPFRTMTTEYTSIRYIPGIGEKSPKPDLQVREDSFSKGRATGPMQEQTGLQPAKATTDAGDNDTSLRSWRRTRQGWNSHGPVAAGV